MNKKLKEMSLEERCQLFPIFLVEHNKDWVKWYDGEKNEILSIIPKEYIERISHIGSTAILEIWAKNIIDILVEIKNQQYLDTVKNILINNGWICKYIDENQIILNKGYTEQGFAERVFHLHIRIYGDNDELFFRDYLNENSEIAKEYEALKLSLWQKFEYNREEYTNAKTEFIRKYTELAKNKYKGRYI